MFFSPYYRSQMESKSNLEKTSTPRRIAETPFAAIDLSLPNNNNQELMLHISKQCKILGDSIAGALDKFLPNFDQPTQKMIPLLKELTELCQDQAKASVVEDQLQALATTILEPVEELKPIQDRLLATVEEEIRSLFKTSVTSESIETLNMNQNVILKELRKINDNDSTGWIAKIVENLKKVK